MIVFVRGVYKPPKVEVCVPRDLEWQRSGTSNGGSGTSNGRATALPFEVPGNNIQDQNVKV